MQLRFPVSACAFRCSKTVVLEMAIARLLHESAMSLGNRKIIYVSPIKVLALSPPSLPPCRALA